MTDYEPLYAEPAEPSPRRRFAGARPWLVLAIVAILAANLGATVMRTLAEQDPALEAPSGGTPAQETPAQETPAQEEPAGAPDEG